MKTIIFFRLISEKKLNKKKIKIFISTELKMPSVSNSQILPLNIKCRDEKFKWEQCNKKLKTFICSRKFRSFELFSSCFVFAFFCKNFFVIERKKRDVDDFNSSKYLQTYALKRKKAWKKNGGKFKFWSFKHSRNALANLFLTWILFPFA